MTSRSDDDVIASQAERPVPKPRTSITMTTRHHETTNSQPQDEIVKLEDEEKEDEREEKPAISYNRNRKTLLQVSSMNKTFTSGISPLLEVPQLSSPSHKKPGNPLLTLRSLSQDDSSKQLQQVPRDGSGELRKQSSEGNIKIVGGTAVRLRAKSSPKAGARLLKLKQEKSGLLTLALTNEMRGQRRVSCRDLGKGDCEGWLWRKRTTSSSSMTSSKWSKRWVVIKQAAVYCFRSNEVEDERRAECYIKLPGYQVMPATECKRKFAFRITHAKRMTFYFAAERQMDMSRWMNKMGLAAIEYHYDDNDDDDGDDEQRDETYVSDSDNEEDQQTRRKETTDQAKEKQTGTTSQPEESTYKSAVERHKSSAATNKEKAIKVRKKSHSLEDLTTSSSAARSDGSEKISSSHSSELLREDSPGKKKNKKTTPSKVLSSLVIGAKLRNASDHHHHQQKKNKTSKIGDRRSSPQVGAAANSPLDEVKRMSYDPSASPSSSSSSHRSSTASLVSSSRRDAMGRPCMTSSPSIASSISSASTSKSLPPDECDLASASVQDLCKAIKKAEVDINGSDRRTSLRRKMTLLSRDPVKNEKLLKRRALERELKAKEQELEYYNRLLLDGSRDASDHVTSTSHVTGEKLRDWLNEHVGLIGDLEALRSMLVTRKPVVANSNSNNNNRTMRPRSWAVNDVTMSNRSSRVISQVTSRTSASSQHQTQRRSFYLETDL